MGNQVVNSFVISKSGFNHASSVFSPEMAPGAYRYASSVFFSETNSKASHTSWRKFVSENTAIYSEEDIDSAEFYNRLQAYWESGRYQEVIDGIDEILDVHLPALEGVLRSFFLTIKSKCYEHEGRWDLALIEAEKALCEAKKNEWFFQQICNQVETGFDLMNYLQMRKAGLMLHDGKKEEAFAMLRKVQPTTIAGVLVYRSLEQRSKVSLLIPNFICDEDNLMSLFLAGRYDKVIEKMEAESNRYSCHSSSAVRLHAAALAMAGRTEEALMHYKMMRSECTLDIDETIYALIQALHEEQSYPFSGENRIEVEFEIGFPVHLFMAWLTNQSYP